MYPAGGDLDSYDWRFRNDLEQSPSEPYALNPLITVLEISNLSNGGKNIFGVIFDNVTGKTGEIYSKNAFGGDWNYRDDVAYVIEDTNQNSTIDFGIDKILDEVIVDNSYSDFGGLWPNNGSYDVNTLNSFLKRKRC